MGRSQPKSSWPKTRFPVSKILLPGQDLGLSNGVQGELFYPDDLGFTLAAQVIIGPNGARIAQGNALGQQIVQVANGVSTLPAPTLVNIVPPRTDTATTTIGPIAAPECYEMLFYASVTAISGAGASLTLSIQSQNSQGTWSSNVGGVVFSAITTVSDQSRGINPAYGSAQAFLAPSYRILATIAGTTPSITWFMDVIYK